MEWKKINVVSLALWLSPAWASAAGPGMPINLRCEYQVNPIAVDTPAPRLSWQVNDERRGAAQSAYQVLAATSPGLLKAGKPDMWDSGKVHCSRSIHVVYGGKPLDSARTYYWKVRTWDTADVAAPYSTVASWEMGLLKPSDWEARWIALGALPTTGDKELADWKFGKWIWHATQKGENKTVWLRRTFDLDPATKVKKGRVRCSADDTFQMYLNGKEIGSGSDWRQMYDFQVGNAIRGGKNVLAVKVHNATGPCGFTFSLRADLENAAAPVWVLSDDQWKAGEGTDLKPSQAEFDDGAWPKAGIVGEYGCEPWGKCAATPTQKFLRSMMVRKEFDLDKKVISARARVCGLGGYELRINGKRVSDDLFVPGWTLFGKRVQYQTYDVSRLLNKGRNAIGAILGNSWWHGRIGGENAQPGRESLRLILQLDVEYADGTRTRPVTDPTWKTHPSPILNDCIYDGEGYDARMETAGWDMNGFKDENWQPATTIDQPIATLTPQTMEPIRAIEDLPVKQISEPKPGVFVFDFGQNLTGWCRLSVKGAAGDKIVLRHAEELNRDGSIYTANLRSAKATDTYILKGQGAEVWEPRFTYHGFRYAEITGLSGKPDRSTLTARMICSTAPKIGEFECSVDVLNKVQHAILWGQRGNMYSVPTDCPQRDERLGWTGDAQMFANTACWNLDMSLYFTKWMRDIRDCQGPDGATRDVNPCNGWGPASPAWGDVCIIVPWQVYRHSGDKRIIEENWDCMAGYIGYMTKHSKGFLYERDGYGDWIAVVGSPKAPISAGYYYYDCVLLSRMARAIGRHAEAAEYENLAANIRRAFNAKFLDTQANGYPGRTQSANVLPLFFGLVPEHRVEAVAGNVVKDIVARRMHLSTGFLGTGYINPVLTSTGHHDIAWRLAEQTTYPSWGYMVRKGATTIWELWNSDTAGPGMNSRNHFCLGAVGEWYYESLAGILPEEPGFRVTRICPRPMGNLTWVKSSVRSLYGPIASQWELKGTDLTMKVTIPANTEARIYVPTFGARQFTIREGGVSLVENGTRTGSSRGITFSGMEGDCAVFRSGAGQYNLMAQSIGRPQMAAYEIPAPPPMIEGLSDDFGGNTINAAQWEVIDMGLESMAASGIVAKIENGELVFAGIGGVDYWAGRTLLSRGAFNVPKGKRLEVQVDRVAMDTKGSGARTSLWLWVDSANYVMFSQDTEKGCWSYNLNGATGHGNELGKVESMGRHTLKLIHDGHHVDFLIDGKRLGEVAVGWNEGIRVAITGQARLKTDGLTARFDNVKAELRPAR